MYRHRTVAVALFALLITLSLTTAAAADCKEILATASTAWIEESQAEVGEVRGHLNGSMFLKFEDEPAPDSKRGTAPNLVIVTADGEIRLWVSGKSFQREDGTWVRYLTTDSSEGTGAWADHAIFFDLEGTFITGRGGEYQISGKACPPGEY